MEEEKAGAEMFDIRAIRTFKELVELLQEEHDLESVDIKKIAETVKKEFSPQQWREAKAMLNRMIGIFKE